jgi:MFS transporter, MHS family, shikimate and dehydroshikimate transport protein
MTDVRAFAAGGDLSAVAAVGHADDMPSPDTMWKVALASAVGNTIEYYDFTLYATATALVFNKIFFPTADPLVGSLAAFVTFFVGYCARPLGGRCAVRPFRR